MAPSSRPGRTVAMATKSYWHGTSRGGAEIAREGVLRPGTKPIPGIDPFRPTPEDLFHPLPGRVYLSPDLDYAIIYALGGAYAGTPRSDQVDAITTRRGDPYGYVFRIDDAPLERLWPDEDAVGEVLGKLLKAGNRHHWLADLADDPLRLDEVPSTDMDDEEGTYDWEWRSVLDGVKEGLYADWVKAGKIILGSEAMQNDGYAEQFILEFPNAHVSHKGPVPIAAAWRVDRLRYPELAQPGRFFEIAEAVPLGAVVPGTTGGIWQSVVERGKRAWNAVFGDPSFTELTAAVGLPIKRIPLVGPSVGTVADTLMKGLFIAPVVAERVGQETWIDPALRQRCVKIAKFIDMVTPGPWGSGVLLLGFTAATLGTAPVRAAVRAASEGVEYLLSRLRGRLGVLSYIAHEPDGPSPAEMRLILEGEATDAQERDGDDLMDWALAQGNPTAALERFLVAHHARTEAGLAFDFEDVTDMATERARVRLVAGARARQDRSWAPGTLFHIQVRERALPVPPEFVATPKPPRVPLDGEDRVTPRVSLAPSPEEAWLGTTPMLIPVEQVTNYEYFGWPTDARDFTVRVYTNAVPVVVVEPGEDRVPDAGFTNELWALEPVPLRLVGVAPAEPHIVQFNRIRADVLEIEGCEIDDPAADAREEALEALRMPLEGMAL